MFNKTIYYHRPLFTFFFAFCSQLCMRNRLPSRPHSRPQRPRSFWSAPRIETSGRFQHRDSAIHGLIVKCDKSDWLKIIVRIFCACSKIGTGQEGGVNLGLGTSGRMKAKKPEVSHHRDVTVSHQAETLNGR